ncbi:Aste57867_16297 [Aphanomyces stellatus]|uniref:Aste57867_16297 protein n=1 Tax=Aphanomyces stellatus TaxID=120398 RepID=A0A485L639_9STRA|nr:hypothetical protein As57867_016240 [Aphanomyces stellatus]VFT93073.1 Aste57867_16297 [Aphanomyces stellatus]
MASKTASVDKALRKRLYFREKKRMQRKEIRDEAAYLKNRVTELEAMLQDSTTSASTEATKEQAASSRREDKSMLTWREIAQVFRDEFNQTISENQALVLKAQAYRTLLSDMRQWVEVNLTHEQRTLGNDTSMVTWRNTTLFAAPDSRAMGKEWITQHMYHNTTAMFQRHGFPALDQNLYSIDVASDGANVVHRCQNTVNFSATVLLDMYRRHICEILMVDGARDNIGSTVVESTDATWLHHVVSRHASPEVSHLLVGEFHQPGRTVVVAQQITHDEGFVHYPGDGFRQRKRMVWMEVTATGPTQCKARHLHLFAPSLSTNGEMIPFDEEARTGGFEMMDDNSTQRRQYYDLLLQLDSVAQERFLEKLMAVMSQMAAC